MNYPNHYHSAEEVKVAVLVDEARIDGGSQQQSFDILLAAATLLTTASVYLLLH
ncbi:MAG: hypothetical protein ACFBSG_03860 [Leptolyngbyaceae cyanobacterium]